MNVMKPVSLFGLGVTMCAAVSLASPAAHADIIAFDGFESGNFSGGTGWIGSWAEDDYNVNTTASRSSQGSNSAEARTGSSGGTDQDTLTRSLNVSGFDDITVSVDIGPRFTEDGDEDVIVSFDYGSGTFVVLGTYEVPASGGTVSFVNFEVELDELLLVGTTQRLRFTSSFNSTSSDFIFLDEITVNGTIPEPASLALLGAGGLLLLSRRRAV